ncbi:MAG: rhodanese-like domain-containing protein [Pseudomonadota bacterium]
MKIVGLISGIALSLLVPVFGLAGEPGAPSGVPSIAAPDAIVEAGDVVVLDVRTVAEFQAGHIENAVNIDVTQAGFSEAIQSLDPKRTYLVHCGANTPNGRADRALATLQQAGFSQLVSLEGGYVAWVAAGGAVTEAQ